jgi:ATP-dependent Clp protease adapter protein ClpS
LSKASWDIVITARRLDQLEETKTQCEEASRVLVLAGDISDERFVQELFKQTVSTFGKAATYKTILDTRLDIGACRAVGPVVQRAGR